MENVVEEGDAGELFGNEKPQVRHVGQKSKRSPAEQFFHSFSLFSGRMCLPDGVMVPDGYEVSVRLDGRAEHHRFVKPLQVVLRSEDGRLVLDFYFEFTHTDGKLYRLCYVMGSEFAVYGVKVQLIQSVQTLGTVDADGQFEAATVKKGKADVPAPSVTVVERRFVKLQKFPPSPTGKRAFDADVLKVEPRWFWSEFFVQGQPNLHFTELRLSLEMAMEFAKSIRYKLTPRRNHMKDESSETESDEESGEETSEEASQVA